MTLEIRGRKLLVTQMFVVNERSNEKLKFNVFDENYHHLTTIDAEDYDSFLEILNTKITFNKF